MKTNKLSLANYTNISFYTHPSKLTNNDEICKILRRTKKLVSQDYNYSNYSNKSGHLKLPELSYPKETSENSKQLRCITNPINNVPTNNNIITIKNNQKKAIEDEDETFKTTHNNFKIIPFPKRIKFNSVSFYSLEMMNSIELYINMPLDSYEVKINSQIIKETIKAKINYYKYNEIKDKTTYLSKTFNENTSSHIEITVKSINILFQYLNKKTNIQTNLYEFMLPFEFLPIFYSMNDSTFIKFLAFYIQIDLDSPFKDVAFNQQNFNLMLNTLNEFQSDYISHPISHKKVFKFNWLTKDNVFDVIVKCPLIEVQLKNSDIIISNFSETDLLFFLINKKFQKWEYYTLHHLNQKKHFRSIINKSFSKLTEKNYLNKKLFLDDKNDLNINYVKDSDDCFNYIFTQSAEKDNIFLSFKSYVIDTCYLRKIKEININFKQLCILERMKVIYKDIDLLIRKLILVDSTGINVNNDYFNNFNEKSLLFYYNSIPKVIQSQSNVIQNINHPVINITQIVNNSNILTYQTLAESELLYLLSKENIDKWKYVFWRMKAKYIEYYEKNKNDYLSRSEMKRKKEIEDGVQARELNKDEER